MTTASDRAARSRLPYAWDLLLVLVRTELKLRYRGTSLGILWSLANPVAFALVLNIAFQHVLKLQFDHYALFILSGLFPWQWFTNSLGPGCAVFVNNASLVKKLPFPRFALCGAVVLGDFVNFVFCLPVLAALTLWEGLPLDPLTWLVGVPVLLSIQTLLAMSIVTILACVNAYLRDLDQLVRVSLLLAFYVTPVLYPFSMIPPRLVWIVYANPLAPVIVSWRALVLDGALSPWIGVAALQAVALGLLALVFYRRLVGRLAEVV
jgi:lipopolysaccharide transport system permease protein